MQIVVNMRLYAYSEADLEGGVRPPKIRKAYVIQR